MDGRPYGAKRTVEDACPCYPSVTFGDSFCPLRGRPRRDFRHATPTMNAERTHSAQSLPSCIDRFPKGIDHGRWLAEGETEGLTNRNSPLKCSFVTFLSPLEEGGW